MESIGGYRLVRRLGEGPRAEVFLGHAGGSVDSEARTAAIKIYRPAVAQASIDTEIEALARASSRHLVRLRDLATASDGRPVLILDRLGPSTLASLIADRGALDAGEAVTIIVPLAEAVQELHRVGVVHGGVRLAAVSFDVTGAPVLASFGRASVVGPMPEREGESSLTPAVFGTLAGIIGDLGALATSARAVIELTPRTAEHVAILDWLAASHPSRDPGAFVGELIERAFGLAPAAPVRFAPPSPAPSVLRGTPVVPPAPIPARRPAHSAAQHPARPPAPGRPAWFTALRLPDWLDEAVTEAVSLRLPIGALVKRMLGRVRRPVWFGMAVAVIVLVVALAVVPVGRGPADALGPSPLAGSDEAGSDEPGSGEATTEEAGTQAGTGAGTDPVQAGAIAGDDPVLAAVALLERRIGCLETLSVLCLDGVDEAGSAAAEADGYLVRRMQESGPAGELGAERFDGAQPILVERMGDSAILALAVADPPPDSAPASLLLVRGEAGWRIRDLIVG